MITLSTGKTGSLTRISTSGSGWTNIPLYDNAGNAVSATNKAPVDFIDLVNSGAATGDCWLRINESTGAAYFIPAGASRRIMGFESVYKIEIIRDAAVDVISFVCTGERAPGIV